MEDFNDYLNNILNNRYKYKSVFEGEAAIGGFIKKDSTGSFIGISTEEIESRKKLLRKFESESNKIQQLFTFLKEKIMEAYRLDSSLFFAVLQMDDTDVLKVITERMNNFNESLDNLLYIADPTPAITEETLQRGFSAAYDSAYKTVEDTLNALKKVYPKEASSTFFIAPGNLPTEKDELERAESELEEYMHTKVVKEPKPITSIEEKRATMLSIISSAFRVKPHSTIVTEDNINDSYVQYYNCSHSNNKEDVDKLYTNFGPENHPIDYYERKHSYPLIIGSWFEWAVLKDNNTATFYSYSNIPKSKRPNLLHFDKNFNFDEFLAIYDTSSDCTNGFVFMLSGLYIPTPGILSGKFISYSDISGIYYTREIKTKDGTIFKFPCKDFFNSRALVHLIKELMRVDSSYWSYRIKTGKKDRLHVDHDSYFAGEREGYVRASAEYEKKLRDQAEKFLRAKDEWKNSRDEYESLLDECAKTIDELNEMISKNAKNEYINRRDSVQYVYDSLKELRLE
ncbi:MAG: hypothetical protein IKQ13_12575 [Treponema sp.]|nr:hypothetical protein [Treponema sp.]